MKFVKMKKNKLLLFLGLVVFVCFVFGLVFIECLSGDNQELVKTSINGYFSDIVKGNLLYLKNLVYTLGGNLILLFLIWILGISVIGFFLVIGILGFNSFLVGFSLSSIIYTYGGKGIFISLVYVLPELVNLFIIFVLSYCSVSFSFFLFNYLFRKKEYNRKKFVFRYIKFLFVFLLMTIINSLISVFLVPLVLRIF